MISFDLDAVLALESESPEAPHWTLADYSRCIADPEPSSIRRCALVIEVDGVFAGFAIARALIAADGGEAELESIVISPDLRGRGLGTGLLAALLERIRVLKVQRLDLEVRISNNPAIRLYERIGFVENGRRPRYYRRPDEDALLMSLVL